VNFKVFGARAATAVRVRAGRGRIRRGPCLVIVVVWPLQGIFLLRGFCARITHPFIAPPTCIAHPGAILLHHYWAQYTTPPPTSRVYAIHHTILLITISCKGQVVVVIVAVLLLTE